MGHQYGGENGAVLWKKKLIFLTLPYKVLLWQPNVSANTKHSIAIEMIKYNAEGEETWLQLYILHDLYFRFHCAFLRKSYVLPKVTAVTGLKDSLSPLCSPEDSQESVPLSSSLNIFFMNIIFI